MLKMLLDLMMPVVIVLQTVVLHGVFLSAVSADDVVEFFTDNGFGNAVATIQHPCAEYAAGKTFLAYQGPHEDPYVCSYDHTIARWAGPFKAGVSALGTMNDPTKPDNHGRPALVVDNAGYVHIVFGGHGGSPSLGHNEFGAHGS